MKSGVALNMTLCSRLSLLATGTIMTFVMGSGAFAAENLTIISDRSTAVTLPETPGTVVIGNPSIADASVEGRLLFLHGKAFGATNVVVLNGEGRHIAEYMVRVRVEDPDAVVVFKQSGKDTVRETYSCATSCEPTLQVGDSGAFTAAVNQNMSIRSGAAREQLANSN